MSAEQSKKVNVCMVYEIKWECDMRQLEGKKRDFQITKNLSDWLCDMTTYNIDNISKVEREWHILHVTPGHLVVFLTLCSDDLSPRIQYPFMEPDNWPSRPLPSAEWTEQPYDYWNFLVRLQGLQLKPLYSTTRVRTK